MARNFTNKLWNAARFALINLQDCQGLGAGGSGLEMETRSVSEGELTVEDRWLLSRLATVTAGVTESLKV